MPVSTPVDVTSAAASGVAITGAGTLYGFIATETSGVSNGAFTLRMTNGSGARVTPRFNLSPGETWPQNLPGGGVAYENGLYVEKTSGTVEIVLFYRKNV